MNEETEKTEKLFIRCDAKLLKNIFKLHDKLVNEEIMSFNKDGINFKTVDPAHVCMIIQTIPRDNIELYDITNNIDIGIDVNKMLSLFTGSIKKNELIALEYDYVDLGLISSFNMFKRRTSVIDINGLPTPKIPNLTLPASVSLNTDILDNFCKQANKISDHFKIVIDKDGLTLKAKGDYDKIELLIEKQDLEAHDCDDSYSSLYSIDYFSNVISNLKNLHKIVTLQIDNDNPIRITGNDRVKTEVLIAPRIESE